MSAYATRQREHSARLLNVGTNRPEAELASGGAGSILRDEAAGSSRLSYPGDGGGSAIDLTVVPIGGYEWLDSAQAAEYLGLHRDTLRRLAAARAIPTEQDGRGCKLFFRRSALDEWRKSGGRVRHLASSGTCRRRIKAVGDMTEDGSTARRVRVERNIYRRPSGVYEVGFKDGRGKQRWRTVVGGITAARALRDELLARRGRGERVVSDGRLRFADAAAKWLAGPVLDLRARTQECYRNALEQHLLFAIGTQRLDAISPDDLALLVRELRSRGFSESTIVIVLGVTNRVYRYAARRLGWAGTNPVSLMLPSERPKPSQGKRRRIFEGREVEQTIRAARWSKPSGPRGSRTGRCSPSRL